MCAEKVILQYSVAFTVEADPAFTVEPVNLPYGPQRRLSIRRPKYVSSDLRHAQIQFPKVRTCLSNLIALGRKRRRGTMNCSARSGGQ